MERNERSIFVIYSITDTLKLVLNMTPT